MAEKKFAIIGFPLKHSLSPIMQNLAFESLGIEATYQKLEMTPETFSQLRTFLQSHQIQGFNVTVPYKEKVFEFLDRIDPIAQKIGAVNTVKITDGIWEGFNTDWIGFKTAIEKDLGFSVKDKKVLVLGAGGSTRACVYALLHSQVGSVVIANRTYDKAVQMIRELQAIHQKAALSAVSLQEIDQKILDEIDLVVNTTSCGLNTHDPLLLDQKIIPKTTKYFYDFIYNPVCTGHMKLFEDAGWKTSNGLGMLLFQGVEAFEIWTDQKPPADKMRKALEEHLKKSGNFSK